MAPPHRCFNLYPTWVLNPEWEWDFLFGFPLLDAALEETLKLEAWDRDTVKSADRLGSCELRGSCSTCSGRPSMGSARSCRSGSI